MSGLTYSAYPPSRTPEEQAFLINAIQDKACEIGCMVRTRIGEAAHYSIPAPITLYPSLFPRSCFDAAQAIQTDFNSLYASIACNTPWLERTLSKIAKIDDFVARLWKVHYDIAAAGGYKHKLSLGLFRSDYMVHMDGASEGSPRPQIKQVEFNTIASSFAGLSSKVRQVHDYMTGFGFYPEVPGFRDLQNPALETLAAGLIQAHRAYTGSDIEEPNSAKACVIFIVQENESNVFDQRHLESLIWTSGIPVFRVVFDNVIQELSVREDGSLVYHAPNLPQSPSYEVSVVYYRAGYAPHEYKTEDHWQARLLIERSRAVKCPTILTQLAGTKKVQQVLEAPDADNLLPGFHIAAAAEGDGGGHETLLKRLKPTFARMYSMEGSPMPELFDPKWTHNFVLKPQREGGGNNIYREDITTLATQLENKDDLGQYILMEMIEPPPQKNVILRNGEVLEGNVICELGVYGACLWDVDASGAMGAENVKIRYNEGGGFLLRTKGHNVSEGGVAAGFGALDSVCLVEDDAI